MYISNFLINNSFDFLHREYLSISVTMHYTKAKKK